MEELWQHIWDSLIWRFMHNHRDYFLQDPRLVLLIKNFDKMPKKKQVKYIKIAEDYMLGLNEKNN
jgi:deoxyribodipyrimidine photolyase-related protein